MCCGRRKGGCLAGSYERQRFGAEGNEFQLLLKDAGGGREGG